jgi:hypothetical protein
VSGYKSIAVSSCDQFAYSRLPCVNSNVIPRTCLSSDMSLVCVADERQVRGITFELFAPVL